MRIAILSSHPSIIKEWESRCTLGWDLVVGINTTAWFIDVDWLVWMDAAVIRGMIHRDRQPRIGSVWHTDDFKWCQGPMEYEAFPCFSNGRTASFTLPNAMNWLSLKYPDAEIEVFGAKCDNGPNVGNLPSPRRFERWEEERMWIRLALDDHLARKNACKAVK